MRMRATRKDCMRPNFTRITLVIGLLGVFLPQSIVSKIPIFTQNDFFPLFSSAYYADFYDEGLKYYSKGKTSSYPKYKTCFTATTFIQRASLGRPYDPSFYSPSQDTTTGLTVFKSNNGWPFSREVTDDSDQVPAGDINGPWGVLGLCYGTTPAGQTQAPTIAAGAVQKYQDGQPLSHDAYDDFNKYLGYLSVPLNYKKMGIRFSFALDLTSDFTFLFNTGIANIKQNAGEDSFINLSSRTVSGTTFASGYPDAVYGTKTPAGISITTMQPDVNTVNNAFMINFYQIFDEIGLDISAFNASAIEDMYCSLLWHHNVHVNETHTNTEEEWSPFIFTPFMKMTGIFATGKLKNERRAFSLPFGSNGHHGIHIAAGINIDFFETIELCLAGGTTHFFQRAIAGRFVPTHPNQTAIYPFKTDIIERPGKIFFFIVGMNAFYFVDRLSANFEYVYIDKQRDTLSLVKSDPAFFIEDLEETTLWNVQSFNIALEYDLSPNISISGLAQIPFSVRGAYATLLLGSSITLQF